MIYLLIYFIGAVFIILTLAPIQFNIIDIIMVIFWPITISIYLCILAFDRYREAVAAHIKLILIKHSMLGDWDNIHVLTIRELKLIHHAIKIEAIYADQKQKKLVKQALIDKDFEKHILEVDDGRK